MQRVVVATSRRRLALAVVLLSPLLGCSDNGGLRSVPAGSTPITERRVLTQGDHGKQLGEDCSNGGASDCASSVCLHTSHVKQAEGRGGYVCAKPCASATECPTDWRCGRAAPTGGPMCMPPTDWVPHVASTTASPFSPDSAPKKGG